VIEMPTSEEINRSVQEADATRTAKRSEVCTRVAELAEQRAAQAEQLADTERELGEILADGGEVITIDEVARFTGVSASELDQWFAGRKTARGKRKRSTGVGPGKRHVPDHDRATVATPADVEAPTPRGPASSPASSPDGRVRVAAGVS
jgi:hypothetical protein